MLYPGRSIAMPSTSALRARSWPMIAAHGSTSSVVMKGRLSGSHRQRSPATGASGNAAASGFLKELTTASENGLQQTEKQGTGQPICQPVQDQIAWENDTPSNPA